METPRDIFADGGYEELATVFIAGGDSALKDANRYTDRGLSPTEAAKKVIDEMTLGGRLSEQQAATYRSYLP